MCVWAKYSNLSYSIIYGLHNKYSIFVKALTDAIKARIIRWRQ